MKRYATVAKFAVSLCLLAWLYVKVDFSPLKESLLNIRLDVYVLGLIVVLVYVFVQSLILKILIAAGTPATAEEGGSVGVLKIMRLALISTFFGFFFPGGAGPDVVLCYNLFKTSSRKDKVLSAMVFARGATLVGMVLTAYIATFFAPNIIPGFRHFAAVFLGIVLGVSIFFVTGAHSALFGRFLDFLARHRTTAFLHRTASNMLEAVRNPKVMAATIPLFVLIGILRVAMDIISVRALGIDLPLSCLFLFAPVVTIAAVIPVSISGFGVREGTYAALFAGSGLPAACGVAVSLLTFGMTVWLCLLGGLLFAVSGMTTPPAESENSVNIKQL